MSHPKQNYPVSLWCSALDVLLEFISAEVTVMVKFGESLSHTQGREAGRRALVPTLLHDLHNGRQDLDTCRQTSDSDAPHTLL